MTAAQTLTREVAEIMRQLEPRLGADALAGDQVRAEIERAGRTLTALGALVGLAPRVEVTEADVRAEKRGAGDACPACGEKLRLVPSAGFGTKVMNICGACGYEPAAA